MSKKDRQMPVAEPNVKDPEGPPPNVEESKGPEKAAPTEPIKLGPAEGSEIQIAFMDLTAKSKDTEKVSLELQLHQAKTETLQHRLQTTYAVQEAARKQLLAVLDKHGVPNGWDFNRDADGNYVFTPHVKK